MCAVAAPGPFSRAGQRKANIYKGKHGHTLVIQMEEGEICVLNQNFKAGFVVATNCMQLISHEYTLYISMPAVYLPILSHYLCNIHLF